MLLLEIVTSLAMFANKVQVERGKKNGWAIGVIACSFGILYFSLLGLYVYTVLNLSLVFLMGYGHMTEKKRRKPAQWVEVLVNAVLSVIMPVLGVFAFRGDLTVMELASSFGFVIGTYLLTHKRKRWGWWLYALAHVLGVAIGSETAQWIFAFFQAASAVVAIRGAARES